MRARSNDAGAKTQDSSRAAQCSAALPGGGGLRSACFRPFKPVRTSGRNASDVNPLDGERQTQSVHSVGRERPVVEPPTWDLFRWEIESREMPAWDKAGLWSLDVLKGVLGERWPEETYELRQRLGDAPLLPAEIAASFGYPMHFAELLELALRLRILENAEGMDQMRTDLRAHKEHHRWMHSRLQLELGSLLLVADVAPRFEQSLPGGQSGQGAADLLFTAGDGGVVVSAYTLYPTDVFREAMKQSDRLFEAFTSLHMEHHRIGIRAEIAPELDAEDEEQLIEQVRSAMGRVTASGRPERLDAPAATVAIRPPSTEGEAEFYVGARSPEQDLWPRIVRQLGKKAAALACSAPVWVRADLRDGVWQATPWATRPLEQRLPELEQALRAAFDPAPAHLGGFVLSSGAVLAHGTVEHQVAETESGCVALRYPLRPLRGREVVIVPVNDQDSGKLFEKMYVSETDWLQTALEQAGLPSVTDLFPTPAAA